MTEEVKSYELRPLQSRDIWPMVQIINKIGIKEFKAVMENSNIVEKIQAATNDNGEVDLNSIGVTVVFELVGAIMENLPKAKDDIYGLLENLSGIERADLETMDMITFVDMVTDVIASPQFKDFTKVASKFAK